MNEHDPIPSDPANDTSNPKILIRPFVQDDLEEVQIIFKSYHEWLNLDLSFQDYENEFKHLPGKYDLNQGGSSILAFMKQDQGNKKEDNYELIGFIGLRKLELTEKVQESLRFNNLNSSTTSVSCCEIKRLFVKPKARGLNVGTLLITKVLKEAKRLQYDYAFLDTLPDRMKGANLLYKKFGFVETLAYYDSPLKLQTSFLMKKL